MVNTCNYKRKTSKIFRKLKILFIERLLDKVEPSAVYLTQSFHTNRTDQLKMVNFFPKDPSLIKLVYFTFKFAAMLNNKTSKWYTLYHTFQKISLRFACISSITELFIGSKELKDFVTTLSSSILCLLAHSKLFIFATKKKEIQNFFEILEKIRMIILEDEENSHLITEAEIIGGNIIKGLFISYLGFPLQAFFINIIIESISNKRNLLLKLWFPWSTETLLAHTITNALIPFIAISCACIYVAIYFMEITFTLYISAYIKILQNNLINKGIRNEGIYEHHKVIIQIIKLYNELFTRDFYLETIIAPIIPCGYGLAFLRAIQSKDISQAIVNCITAIFCLLPSIVSCCSGQMIINEMERLHETTYMSNWCDEDLIMRKNLLTMMIKTTNPSTINYRLFIKFDHIVLSAVFQVIYSYFMLMINLDEQ